MANPDKEDVAVASPRAAGADDAISDTHPTADLEVATRAVVTEVELREMRDEPKNLSEEYWAKKVDKSSKMKSCEIYSLEQLARSKRLKQQ